MTWRVRYTRAARDDLRELYGFLLERDVIAAERAVAQIEKATGLLQAFPFACRKADLDRPCLRELLVPFDRSGYVLLYEIDSVDWVAILAVRHQREDDYH